jgi:hypothetical protein
MLCQQRIKGSAVVGIESRIHQPIRSTTVLWSLDGSWPQTGKAGTTATSMVRCSLFDIILHSMGAVRIHMLLGLKPGHMCDPKASLSGFHFLFLPVHTLNYGAVVEAGSTELRADANHELRRPTLNSVTHRCEGSGWCGPTRGASNIGVERSVRCERADHISHHDCGSRSACISWRNTCELNDVGECCMFGYTLSTTLPSRYGYSGIFFVLYTYWQATYSVWY